MQCVLNKINFNLYAQKISNRQLSAILTVSHTTTNAMLSSKRECNWKYWNWKNRVWPRKIQKAAIPKICFHDLRQTHATLLLAKGVKVISEQLGHSNIKITLDTYSHVLPTMQEDAVNKIEEIL